jgi:hypothetical protein
MPAILPELFRSVMDSPARVRLRQHEPDLPAQRPPVVIRHVRGPGEPGASDRRIGPVSGQDSPVASYSVNPDGVAWARHLIDTGQYVLDSDWGKVQPRPEEQNAFLKAHSWEEYARWHLGLTDGARDHTKARYAFVYGDFRRLHRMGIIASQYRAAEWRHKEIELAAHDLLQRLDRKAF